MVFSSSLFLLYFLPFFLLIYYFLPLKFKNLFAMVASLLFYAWGAPKYVFIVIFSIFLDFYLAQQIHKHEGKKRKLLLITAVAINISFLLYFKYSNFFIHNLNESLALLGFGQVKWINVALPIGISFFTFHEMSYVIDVYRGVKAPLKKLSDYALYILFFPQLIAGPIIRFNEIADQIQDRKYQDNVDNRLVGFFRFCIGLGKKVLIANVMGAQADYVLSQNIANISTPDAWIGILAYTFQIYYDFSGYSDMAIGIALMIGFKFPENFDNPYISKNITEFWRRWHMTLSRWMRDYLYIPLGGNRVSKPRMYLNLWLVFLISGFWHGASWNFILWGAYHGFFLVADRLFLLKFLKKIGKLPSIIFTFFITIIGWVLFRIESISGIKVFLKKMFSMDFHDSYVLFNEKFYTIFIIAVFFAFYGAFGKIEKFQIRMFSPQKYAASYIALVFLGISLFILSLASITSYGFNPFIYFRF